MRKDGRDISKYYEKYYGNGENTEREGTGKEMKMKKEKEEEEGGKEDNTSCVWDKERNKLFYIVGDLDPSRK